MNKLEWRLLVEQNENGHYSVVKKNTKNGLRYGIQSNKTNEVFFVRREWIYANYFTIENLKIGKDGKILYSEGYDNVKDLVDCWWKFYSGNGKNTISKILEDLDIELAIDVVKVLQNKGYDGIIVKNVTVGIQEKKKIDAEYIVFEPNQIKAVKNRKPKKSDDVYDEYTEGKAITQSEYFSKSKIRDSVGRLLVCYHNTTHDFTVFDKNKIGCGGGYSIGKGFYFGSEPILEYGKTMEVYLNITKPYIIKDINDKEEVLKFIKVILNVL